MRARRCLPVYGGTDAGPRPDTRDAVYAAAQSGVAPRAIVERIGAGIDQTIAAIGAQGFPGGEPACARGCAHCCHQRVEVTPPEVVAIAGHLREHWSEDGADPVATLDDLARRLDHVADRMRARQSHRDPVRCAFLDDAETCTIYAARPLACRRGHSLDAAICRAVLEDPALDVVVPDNATIAWNTAAIVIGYREGFVHAQRPLAAYELCGAAAIALRTPDLEARFLAGEDVLAPARTKTEAEVAALLDG